MLGNTKSNAARIPCGKCGGYVGGKLLFLPGKVLQTVNRKKSESRSNNELQEVSRGHSTLFFFKERTEQSQASSTDRKKVSVLKAECQGNKGFLQRDSVEHKGYAEAQSTDRRDGKDRDGASDLLEVILDRDNLNRAYKRVKRNHGAAGSDGMTVEKALPWLKEQREEL